jgi:hypothetical protein
MAFGVHSEVGHLRQAIVHRPGLELSRLTPQNMASLLSDDVTWASRAREEHDVFAAALRDRGVRVHYFGELMAQTLDVPADRKFVRDLVCTPEQLAEYLVGGVLKADPHPPRVQREAWKTRSPRVRFTGRLGSSRTCAGPRRRAADKQAAQPTQPPTRPPLTRGAAPACWRRRGRQQGQDRSCGQEADQA